MYNTIRHKYAIRYSNGTMKYLLINNCFLNYNYNYYYQKLLDYNSNMLRTHEIDIVLECPFNFK